MSAIAFEDWLAIHNLKARYCRCLDTKDWSGYADVFTEDLVMDCSDDIPEGAGERIIHGRDAAVAQVRGFVGTAVTVHQVHAPEIIGIDADQASGIWAMSDIVYWPEGVESPIPGIARVDGFGHYHERYRREARGWRISQMKLTRLDLRHNRH